METKKVDVLVIGAGIVGISTAHALQQAGRQVTVIDRGQVGLGCSYGNAGWITPCFAMPLPQPGMFWKSIGWLLDPESPLYIKPQPSWLLFKWMSSFLTSMNQKKLLTSVEVLSEISKYSLQFYTDLAKRAPQTMGFEQKGLLMVSATPDGVRAAETEMRLMQDRGIPGESLTPDQIRNMEPSLKEGLKGGVYFPTEAHAEPLATVKALAAEFEARGGQIKAQHEVYEFEFENNRIQKVITTGGTFEPELVVLATGTWSRVMAKQLRVSIPILGGKGYSLITENFEVKPQHPIMILEKKIAVTPRAHSVRLAGTLELVDQDESITPRRVQAILKGSHQYLRTGPQLSVREVWRGLRPCTPDGVPLIGPSKKWSNLVYNVGHQMLGLQSAPGAARLASDLIENKSPLTDPRPFRPERYE